MGIGRLVVIIGFVVYVCFGWLLLGEVVPWGRSETEVCLAFVLISALYVFLGKGLLGEIFLKRGVWSDRRRRLNGGLLFGMSSGLLLAGACAIFGPHGMEAFENEKFVRLLCGGDSLNLLLRKLFSHAQMLGMLNTFLQLYAPISVGSGIFALLAIKIFDLTLGKTNELKQ